jgi:hypothetical protein
MLGSSKLEAPLFRLKSMPSIFGRRSELLRLLTCPQTTP